MKPGNIIYSRHLFYAVAILFHTATQAPGTRGVRVDPADLAVGQAVIAVAVISNGDLEVAVSGRRLDHVEVRDAGRTVRAEVDHLIHP